MPGEKIHNQGSNPATVLITFGSSKEGSGVSSRIVMFVLVLSPSLIVSLHLLSFNICYNKKVQVQLGSFLLRGQLATLKYRRLSEV